MRNALGERGARGLARRWLRRAISLPVLVLAWVLVLAATPVALPTLLLADLARGPRPGSLHLVRAWLFGIVWLSCEVGGVVVATALWLGVGGSVGLLSRRQRERFERWNFRLQCVWGTTLARAGMALYRLRIEIEHEAAVREGPFLLLLRHASMLDTVLAMLTISAPHGIQLRYVLKHTLLWDPCIDIVGNRLPNWFVRRSSPRSRDEIEAVARLADDLGPNDGVLLYPEGTRFTQEKRRRLIEKAERRGDAQALERARGLRHVLPPRAGGPTALLEYDLRLERPADVVICSHTGFEGSATLGQLLGGELVGRTIRLRFWRHRPESLPREHAEIEKWLYRQWIQVDRHVERYAVGLSDRALAREHRQSAPATDERSSA